MRKLLLMVLIISFVLPTTIYANSTEDDSWKYIQYDPAVIQTWEHGQVISQDPYKIVDFRGGKDFEVFYILTYQGWERGDNTLVVHWIDEKVDMKTGKLTQPLIPGQSFLVDYFLEYDNSADGYKITSLPPIWDRPPTDPQAIREGKPKVIDWLYDSRFHWGYRYIYNLFDQGIINGFPDGSFKPDNEVTYEQFIKMLVLTAGINVDTSQTFTYEYTNFSSWARPFVNEAINNGIATNQDISSIKGTTPISREVAVYMLMNAYANEVPINNNIDFMDNDSINYLDDVKQAVSLGIINGFEDNTFRPQDTLTRAQASKILVLLQEKL